MSAKNIVIFGRTGAGKSSVVNLVAGEKRAQTSNETVGCTLHWQEHLVAFYGHSFRIFDTVGMEEPQVGMKEYLAIIENSYNLITKLQDEGGIDLLLFCVRAGRFSSTIQSNYRLFYEWLCEKKVPIVIIITGLEREENMDEWWIRSKPIFDKYGIIVNGHACITAINGSDWQRHYEESRCLVRDLVLKHCYPDSKHPFEHDKWFERVVSTPKGLLLSLFAPKKRDIITILTKRCGMPREAAVELAMKIRQNWIST